MSAVNAVKSGRKYAGFYPTIDPGQCTPLHRVGSSPDPYAPIEIRLKNKGPRGNAKRRRMNVHIYRGLRLILDHAALPPMSESDAKRVKEAVWWLRSVEDWYEQNTMAHTEKRSAAARQSRSRPIAPARPVSPSS